MIQADILSLGGTVNDDMLKCFEDCLQRIFSANLGEDPTAEVIMLVAESDTHTLTQYRGNWRIEGPVLQGEARRLAHVLCLSMNQLERNLDDYRQNQQKDLDPVRRYANELQRLWEVVDSVSEAIIALDRDHRIESWNRAAELLFEHKQSEVVGRIFSDVLPELLSRSDIDNDAQEARQGGRPVRDVQWKPGHWLNLRIKPLRDVTGNERGLVVVAYDSTAARQQQRQLEQLAWTDPLTGLPNRPWLMAELDSWLENLARVPRRRFAVANIDLDRFKTVNDMQGHRVGDRLLQAVAERLSKVMGRKTQVARFGGDEFTMLLDSVPDALAAEQAALKIQQAFRQPLQIDDGRELYISITIGIAVASAGMEAEQILRDADIAIMTAKTRGVDQIQVFTSDMRTIMAEQADMDEALRRDVERHLMGASRLDRSGPFQVVFQPIIRTRDDYIDGFEALVRWRWKDTQISPVRFVKSAEESGLIVPIGRWVLENACRQILEWQKRYGSAGPGSINVNVSVRQLRVPGYVEDVASVLKDIGLSPEHLCLEITESSFLADEDTTRKVISGLQEIGVRMSMDDFGTGYSSFSYLSRLPFSSLKVDRSFVCRITEGERQDRIVHSIVNLALDLGMSATAEGVELAEEYKRLKEMGCPRVQGFFFSKPMTSTDATAWLDQHCKQGGRR